MHEMSAHDLRIGLKMIDLVMCAVQDNELCHVGVISGFPGGYSVRVRDQGSGSVLCGVLASVNYEPS